MNLIFAAVDGTGPKDDVVYAEAFEHSFVRTIWRSCPTPFRFYWRGPNDLGFETKTLAERLRRHVKCSLDVWRAKACGAESSERTRGARARFGGGRPSQDLSGGLQSRRCGGDLRGEGAGASHDRLSDHVRCGRSKSKLDERDEGPEQREDRMARPPG